MNKFDHIIGYASTKKELRKISDTLKNRDRYDKLGVHAPRGLLLYGEPGVGKSLMTDAVIGESGRRVFVCRKDQSNGDFVKELKAIFDSAMQNAPSIVYLEDMDKFANGDEYHPDAEEYVAVQSGIDAARGKEVFVLATVNNMRCLPRSLYRAGRFDRVIEVKVPQGKDAEQIVAHYLKTKAFVDNVDAKTIARMMDGHSCAELETVINEAGLYAGYERAGLITMDHLMKAFLHTMFDMPLQNRDDEEDDDFYIDLSDAENINAQIIYHEAGHAVVSEVLCPESVTLICAAANSGKDRNGFTRFYNDHSKTAIDWGKSRIVSALGGMAAVEHKFGIQDAGCERDLDEAFQRMRGLIGNICLRGFRYHSGRYENSEQLTYEQEQIIAAEVERYYQKAKEILASNTGFLEKTAAALAQKGLLSACDVQEIKRECPVTPVNL